MNILFLTLDFPPNTIGGTGIYGYETTKLISKKNIIHIMTLGDKTYTERLNNNLYVHRYCSKNYPFFRLPAFFYHIAKNIDNIVIRYKIDVIHANDVESCMFLKKLPSVLTIHHLAWHNFSKTSSMRNIINTPYIFMEKIAIRLASKIIAVSHTTRTELISEYPEIKDKVSLIHDPIDLEKFFNLFTENGIGKDIKDDQVCILFCPGLAREERKGGMILLEALSLLKENITYKCLITGNSREGNWEQKLKYEVLKRRLTDRVIFLGEISSNQLLECYKDSDIVVFPSIFEGFGLPVLEAMAAGKPVIATKTGEVSYFIDNNKNGIVISPRSSEQLNYAIASLINNPEIRKSMAYQARNDIANILDIKKIELLLQTVYKSCLLAN